MNFVTLTNVSRASVTSELNHPQTITLRSQRATWRGTDIILEKGLWKFIGEREKASSSKSQWSPKKEITRVDAYPDSRVHIASRSRLKSKKSVSLSEEGGRCTDFRLQAKNTRACVFSLPTLFSADGRFFCSFLLL